MVTSLLPERELYLSLEVFLPVRILVYESASINPDEMPLARTFYVPLSKTL
jgi:hypothetical protein